MSRRDIDYAGRRIDQVYEAYLNWLAGWYTIAIVLFILSGLMMTGLVVVMYFALRR